jgi:hypothetical protein
MDSSPQINKSKSKELPRYLLVPMRIIGLLVLILIFFILSLRFGFVQNWTKDQVLAYINSNYHQNIQLENIYFNPVKGLTAGILIRDHHQDTLLYASQVQIGLLKSLLSLYRHSLFLDDIVLNNTVIKVITYEGEDKSNLDIFISKFEDNSKLTSNPLILNLKKLELTDARVQLKQSELQAIVHLDQLNAIVDSVNSVLNYYKLRKILIENPNIEITKGNSLSAINNKDTLSLSIPDSCREGFGVSVDFVNINNGSVRLAMQSRDSLINYSFNNIFFSCFQIYFSNDLAQFDFLHLNGKTKDDFTLKKASINHFKMNTHEWSIARLKLETGRSNVDLKFKAIFSKDSGKTKSIEDAYFLADINKSLIDPKDISYFVPQWNLYNFIRLKSRFPFYLHGNIFGTLNNLKGNDIEFKYEDQFSFQGNIHTRNLLIKGKELVNLKINRLATNAPFIRLLLPEYNIPEGYNKFGNIVLNGNFDGFFDDFVAFGFFQTDIGNIQSDIKVKLSKQDRTALYSGSVTAAKLELGKLLGNTDLGSISFNSKILNGKGLSKESIYANLEAVISDLDYKNYHYRDIQFKGNINKDHYAGELRASDDHMDLELKGNVNKSDQNYKIQLTGTVAKLDFKALHLATDSLSYSGDFKCDFSGSKETDVNGYLEANNSNLFINNGLIEIKNARLEQTVVNGIRKIKLNSDILNSEITGAFNLGTIKNDMLAFLSKKYPGLASVFNVSSKSAYNPILAQGYLFIKDGMKFSKITNLPLLIDKADSDISIDTKKNYFELTSNRFDLSYNDVLLSKLSIDVVGSESLKLLLTSDYLSNNQKKLAGNIKFSTNYNGKSGQNNLQVFDSTNTKILANAASMYSYFQDTFKISFINKDLFFNNNRWKVNPKNNIIKSRDFLSIRDLEWTDSIHYLSLQDNENKGIVLKTDGFDISIVNQFIHNKSIAFYGLFATEFRIPDLNSLNGAMGKIDLFQLHFNKDNFGPFHIDFTIHDVMEPWEVNIENIFQEHIIKGKGNINIPVKKQNYRYNPFEFSVDLDLKAFPVKFLENFIASISNTTGSADGKLKFYSHDNELNLTGDMMLNTGTTYINYLGAPIKFKNQPVKFLESAIVFNKLNIEDKLGNTLLLNGSLSHFHLKEFAADVRVTSDKALILDTKKGDNLFYYGYGVGSIDAKFSGPLSKMDMDVSAVTLKGTKISIPIQNNQETGESKFVKFVSHESQPNTPIVSVNSSISGLNLNMKLSMTEDAEVFIIFDELAGDILKGHGRGDLTIKSLRNGLFTVNGNYEIEEGQYLFTLYNFVNKPFVLKRGGTITWTGDPLDANINLEAVYAGLTASIAPLVPEYISGLTQDEKSKIQRQRTEVKVRMLLTGSLLKPTIKFDIDLPELSGELKSIVDYKMQSLRSHEDQLNQQVFGLLVLRTFINTNNNFEGEVIGNFRATAINTLSEMLSNQFSLFASSILSNLYDDVNFISGVDVNIGYGLNNTVIGSTPLNAQELVFSLTHRLWNDKWIVTLGGNYTSNQNTALYGNSYFNPESVIEWNTPVNGLKLRVYYKADESIEGIKHKIGTGVNYRKEFDSFLDFERELKIQSQKYKQEHYEEKKL